MKIKLAWDIWKVIGPVSVIPDPAICFIGAFAPEMSLLESGLTQSNALLLLMTEAIVYNN